MRIHVIDSQQEVPASLWEQIRYRITLPHAPVPATNPDTHTSAQPNPPYLPSLFLHHPFHQVPFYLVQPATIDRLSSSDHWKIDLRNLRKWWQNLDELNTEEDIFKVLKKRRIKPLACYLPEVSRIPPSVRRLLPTKNGPAIFLCPERIFSYPYALLILQKVVIHELIHAYRGTEKWYYTMQKRLWPRIIEESLANAIAFLYFTPTEWPLLAEFMAQQPPEYAAYTFWFETYYRAYVQGRYLPGRLLHVQPLPSGVFLVFKDPKGRILHMQPLPINPSEPGKEYFLRVRRLRTTAFLSLSHEEKLEALFFLKQILDAWRKGPDPQWNGWEALQMYWKKIDKYFKEISSIAIYESAALYADLTGFDIEELEGMALWEYIHQKKLLWHPYRMLPITSTRKQELLKDALAFLAIRILKEVDDL